MSAPQKKTHGPRGTHWYREELPFVYANGKPKKDTLPRILWLALQISHQLADEHGLFAVRSTDFAPRDGVTPALSRRSFYRALDELVSRGYARLEAPTKRHSRLYRLLVTPIERGDTRVLEPRAVEGLSDGLRLSLSRKTQDGNRAS